MKKMLENVRFAFLRVGSQSVATLRIFLRVETLTNQLLSDTRMMPHLENSVLSKRSFDSNFFFLKREIFKCTIIFGKRTNLFATIRNHVRLIKLNLYTIDYSRDEYRRCSKCSSTATEARTGTLNLSYWFEDF